MCGIAGMIGFNPDVEAVARMTGAQAHRGPDGDGCYRDGRAALGHRRLSIIDVSDAGRQPMTNETGTVHVTYNGEIYNYRELRATLIAAGHRLRSQSDTEVLVHGYEEWGAGGLLKKLRGMFAFGLWDSAKARLILARDRLGIKPLYYVHDAKTGQLSFASEVKALVQAGVTSGETDRAALAGFLLLGSVPSPRTIVRDVRCLPPGHYLIAEDGRVRVERYWDLSYAVSEAGNLNETLRDALERHLVSDVPLGIFLSGGVDSAGVVALAQGHGALKTLTISFDESEFDEGAQARSIAERFHTDHHELRVRSGDFLNELPKILAAMDQPTNDGVNTYFVARAAREAGLTVVLSGLGGDELFWGYRHYHWMARWRALAALPDALRRMWIGGAVALGRMRGRESWMRLAALREGLSPEGLYLVFRGFFPAEQVERLVGQAVSPPVISEILPPDVQQAVNYIEMKRYLHDQLLRDTDVFGMAHSVEVRVPYLDDAVVAAASALPGARKLSKSMNKPLLVEAIRDRLIADASRRPKQGFSFPLGQWMRQRAGALREMAMRTDVLERDAVSKLWSAFEQGRLHWSRAWSLVVLGARA